MDTVKICEEYMGWNSNYFLIDEFGNNIASNDGIKIYDSKDGSIFSVIPLGESEELFEEYYHSGLEDASDYELSWSDIPEGTYAKYKERHKKVIQKQREIFPKLLISLRKTLPEDIWLMVDEKIYPDGFYELKDVFETVDFTILYEKGDGTDRKTDVLFVDVYFFKEELAEFDCSYKKWSLELDDYSEVISNEYPKLWRRIQTYMRKTISEELGELAPEMIERVLKGKVVDIYYDEQSLQPC